MQTVKVGSKSLNISFVEELAGLDEVGVVLSQASALHMVLLLLLHFLHQSSIPAIDQGVRIPQTSFGLHGSSEFEVGEDDRLRGNAKPSRVSKVVCM